eukprot:scaffold288054_cov15-Tisochrysis_lutea.AAC.1
MNCLHGMCTQDKAEQASWCSHARRGNRGGAHFITASLLVEQSCLAPEGLRDQDNKAGRHPAKEHTLVSLRMMHLLACVRPKKKTSSNRANLGRIGQGAPAGLCEAPKTQTRKESSRGAHLGRVGHVAPAGLRAQDVQLGSGVLADQQVAQGFVVDLKHL